MAVSMSMQHECQTCPLHQTCFQWTIFDKNKCKVYQARNVTKEKLWHEGG